MHTDHFSYCRISLLLPLLAACGFGTGTRAPNESLAAKDPTPLARCQVGGGTQNPLVTEWQASEKARLEGILGTQPVVVRYLGCELEVLEQCKTEGEYEWTRTTLATDTIEIRSEDELYAKLPLGAATLKGELAQSGLLSVRTRVAGQLRLAGTSPPAVPASSSCDGATHVVSGVSLGAFKLLRGGGEQIGGQVDVHGVGVEGQRSRSQSVLREAGADEACTRTTAEAPDPNCASPLQLFLTPLVTASQLPPEDKKSAVHITFPEVPGERWAIYDADGEVVCSTPCQAWVPQRSQYVLKNTASESVRIPDSLPFTPGADAVANYHPERGSPTWSPWIFWGYGVWAGALGVGALALGINEAVTGPDPAGGRDRTGFFIGGSVMFLAVSGASLYYYMYSEEETFQLEPATTGDRASQKQDGRGIALGPGFLWGTF